MEMNINDVSASSNAAKDAVVLQKPITTSVKETNTTNTKTSQIQNQVNKSNEVDRNKLYKAVEKANKLTQSFNRYLNFSVDESTKELVVKVIDSNTKEVVRQIPPKEMLSLIEHFDKIQALLFSKNV
ncbi:MAG TPA: hypothetical protein DD725_12455 [Deltaproteobacteria bacterium]|nr:hypothetical protein [Deltaproteobacteria bacterium]